MPSPLRNFAKHAALACLYRLPPIPQSMQGTWRWVHPRARFSVSTRTFFRGERHVQKWLAQQLRPGHVFFDVGAHHGWTSLWALGLVGRQGAVHSFEPSPANLAILAWHKKLNRLKQWTIVPKAVADTSAEERRIYLIDSGDSPMNSLTNGAAGMPEMTNRMVSDASIETISLDDYCQQMGLRPNVVKIDVEGAELLVLRGAANLLNQVRPPIILAVHPYWLPAGQSVAQLHEFMEAHGYAGFNSAGDAARSLGSGEYLWLSAAPAGPPLNPAVWTEGEMPNLKGSHEK